MHSLIVVATLLSFHIVYTSSARTSSTEQDAETQANSPADLEQQVADLLVAYKQDFKNELESIKNQLQAQIQHLQSELSIEKCERQNVANELKVKLQSVSEENYALKMELILFFKKMSNLKQWDRPGTGMKSQEAVREQNISTEAYNEISNLYSEFSSEDNTTNPDESHVTLSINSPGGVSYIRWGRTRCEGSASILYTGFAAAKKRKDSDTTWPGSGYICLHNTPQWGSYEPTLKDRSTIAGVEYAIDGNDPFSKVNNGGQTLFSHDVPCTVCQIDTRSNQVMIPGRKSCPTGWTLEYWGYVVTTFYGADGNPYLCLDQAPEGATGGSAHAATAAIYPVEIYCMGTICPPYIHGYEITCAVCSK